MMQRGSTGKNQVLDELLTSSTRARLLTVLLTHPREEFYIRELHRRSGQSLRVVQHEIARLERLGVVRFGLLTLPTLFQLLPRLRAVVLAQ